MFPETLWRTVADQDTKTYYFDSALFPSVFWVDLNKVDLKPGAKAKTLVISKDNPLAGEVSSQFEEAEPFEFLFYYHFTPSTHHVFYIKFHIFSYV